MPNRNGEWSNEELLNCFEPGWDASEAMHHKTRVYQYPEIFGFFDPDMLAPSPSPPPEVQVAFEETMGDAAREKRSDGRPDLILRLHPWFRRWTIFARQSLNGRDGGGNGSSRTAWQPVMVCCEAAKPGAQHFEDKRPADLRDKKYSELWKSVGDFKMPDRRDFEDYRDKCDRRFLPAAERHARFQKDAQRQAKTYESRARDWERDMCDYGYAAYYRDLVRCIGGGQGLPFVPVTPHESYGDGKIRFDIVSDDGAHRYTQRVDARAFLRALEETDKSDEALLGLYERFSVGESTSARAVRSIVEARRAKERLLGGPLPARTLNEGDAHDSEVAPPFAQPINDRTATQTERRQPASQKVTQ